MINSIITNYLSGMIPWHETSSGLSILFNLKGKLEECPKYFLLYCDR